MNITEVSRTIREFHLTLTDEELARVRAESPTLAALLEQMASMDFRPPNGHPVEIVERAAPKGRRPARPGRQTHPRKASARLLKHVPQQCPHCEMEFVKPGNLARHLAKVHPDQAPLSSS